MFKRGKFARRMLCGALCALMAMGTPCALAQDAAEPISVAASEDTTVQSWKHQKAWNIGALKKIRLRYGEKQTDNTFFHDASVNDSSDGTDIKIGYLKFDLSGAAKNGVKSARLMLSGAEDISPYTINIHETDSAWREGSARDAAAQTGVTWYTRPTVGAKLASVRGKGANEYIEVDVTSYARMGATLSFAILSDAQNGTANEFNLNSRESAYGPILQITPYSDSEIAAASFALRAQIDYSALSIDDEYTALSAHDVIALPKVGRCGENAIVWKSSDESILSSAGVVGNIASKENVLMTAEISGRKKSFPVTLYSKEYAKAKINISAQKGASIDEGTFGLFFEDINYAADGGIMAEMIENQSFEFFNSAPAYDYGWSATGSGAAFEITDAFPMNRHNTHCAKITVTNTADGIKNKAYDGIYMNKDASYNVTLYAKSTLPIVAQARAEGKIIASATLKKSGSGEWAKYSGTLTPTADIKGGDFVIGLGSAGEAYIDMVSCISADAVEGLFRRDLVSLLQMVNPGFIRFPGGCAVEGGNRLNTAYRWKDTVGAREERKLNKSRWQNGESKYYCQSYNLGFYEYFLLCEYLGAEALPVVNVGLACMVNSNPEAIAVYKDASKTTTEADLTDEFMVYVNDILDLIDFANSTDFANNKWAQLRKSMGHEAPFNLKNIGVGNEQWERGGNQWRDRYTWVEHFVHKKDASIRLMSSAAWFHTGNEIHDNEYNFVYEKLKTNPNFTYAVDEHYYETPEWFYNNMDYYDKYSREANVFLGEVSARWTKDPGNETICTLENAIAEAAYFTMTERNSDIVKMVSAAPLLCRTGGRKYSQWSPNLIWFDGEKSYATPSYYVQTMYGQNSGDYNCISSVSTAEEKNIFENTVYDSASGELIIKIVNASDKARSVAVSIDSAITLSSDKAKIITLTGDKNAYNSIATPQNVAPITGYAENITNNFEREVPANSFTIIRIKAAK